MGRLLGGILLLLLLAGYGLLNLWQPGRFANHPRREAMVAPLVFSDRGGRHHAPVAFLGRPARRLAGGPPAGNALLEGSRRSAGVDDGWAGGYLAGPCGGFCLGGPPNRRNRAARCIVLRLDGGSKRLDGRTIIKALDLSLDAGEILALIGPSGCGKSTLLELMAGVQEPDCGEIVRACPAALAFQDDALIPWLDVAANLDYALAAHPSAERKRRRRHWLERFGLPGHLRPHAMSGGMRRRLNLARAFAAERALLLLDEPFAFLDPPWQHLVGTEIRRVASAGGAVVVVTHQPEPLVGLECRRLVVAGPPLVVARR